MTLEEAITSPVRNYHSTWFRKFVECLFAAIAVINFLEMFAEVLPQSILAKIGDKVWQNLMLGQVVLGLAFGIGYSIFWHRKEKRGTISSPVKHAWMLAIIRYWLTLEICTYGFAKILRTQFGHSYYRNDTPAGALNGFNLTWHYFAHSYTMAVILGCIQIGGAILLLFRRTTLLGVMVLLPVMVNIVMINVFYDIAAGAFLNSVLFTLALVLLLVLRKDDLLKVLFADTPLPSLRRRYLKYGGRVLAVGAGFGIIYYFVVSNPRANIAGKWKVEQLIRNGDTLRVNAWVTDTTAWQTVYMEEYGRLAFCPNPYVYDNKKSKWAAFKYDTARHNLQLIFNENDTVNAAVSHFDGKHMQLSGIILKDTIAMQLTKN